MATVTLTQKELRVLLRVITAAEADDTFELLERDHRSIAALERVHRKLIQAAWKGDQ